MLSLNRKIVVLIKICSLTRPYDILTACDVYLMVTNTP